MGLCINKRGRGQRRGQVGRHLFQPQAAALVTPNDSTSPIMARPSVYLVPSVEQVNVVSVGPEGRLRAEGNGGTGAGFSRRSPRLSGRDRRPGDDWPSGLDADNGGPMVA